MGCADICVVSDCDNGPDFHSERVVRAAKVHHCCECGVEIAKGERYQVVSGAWDGEFSTFRTCLACVEIRLAFCCDGWTYTQLWEDICEQMFPMWRRNLSDIECLAKLTTDAAIAKVRAEYAVWCGDDDAEAPDAGA